MVEAIIWVGGYPRIASSFSPSLPEKKSATTTPQQTSLAPISAALCTDLRGGQLTKTTTLIKK